jgi:phosphate/sulfate permease
MKNNNVNNNQGEDSSTITKLVLGIVGIWFLAAFVGGMLGIFNQPDTPYVPLFVLVPVIGFTLAYAVSMRMRHTVNQIPLWLITIAHVSPGIQQFFSLNRMESAF